jgi:hypothetical protein
MRSHPADDVFHCRESHRHVAAGTWRAVALNARTMRAAAISLGTAGAPLASWIGEGVALAVVICHLQGQALSAFEVRLP